MTKPTLTSAEYQTLAHALLLAKHVDPLLLGALDFPLDNAALLNKLATLRGLAMFDEILVHEREMESTLGIETASISPSGECRTE